jgi:hypothetical protein
MIALLMLSACGKSSASVEAEQMKLAEDFVQQVFSVTEDDFAEFQSSQTDVEEYMLARYEHYLTDDGMESAMENRFLSTGLTLLEQGEDLTGLTVSIEARSGSDESWYDYQVKDAENDIKAMGSVQLVKDGEEWKIEDVTVKR